MSAQLDCPNCKISMSPFTQETDLVFDRCEQCKGIWLDKGELARVSGHERDFPEKSTSKTGKDSKRGCPKCPQTYLLEIFYTKESRIPIDYCLKCHGLWLDHKELPRVLEILRQHRIEEKKNR